MRILNFSAGPSALPLDVLRKVQHDFLCFGGEEVSVVEVSHRSPHFEEVHFAARSLLRELLKVPDTHEVLLMQGGTRNHFSYVPMNFLESGQHADYVVTGL